MATVKTAISLHDELLKHADSIAREMNLSRSAVFALALEEYIKRHHNRELLDRINAAYDEKLKTTERKYLKKMRDRHRKTIDDEW